MDSSPAKAQQLIRRVSECGLEWHEWDDIYIVYQSSSAETHVFNETTALILKCLEQRPLTTEAIQFQTEAALGVGRGDLPVEDFVFATQRLEELGLIERLDTTVAVQCS